MIKNFFYFAMAACVALTTFTACGDDNEESTVNYTKQKYEDQTASYKIAKDAVEAVIVTTPSDDLKLSLTGVNFTESGKAIFETTRTYSDGATKLKYTTYDVDINGDTYTIKDSGKTIGTIKAQKTKATDINLTISVTIYVEGVGNVTFNTDDPVSAAVVMASVTSGNICRTWYIERMKLTLDFDSKTDVSSEVYNGKLTEFLELAENNDVKLSDKDREQLNKEIKSLTIDKYGLFTLAYSDGGSDAASWSWNSSDLSSLSIKLKDFEMGNKFLENNSKIIVQYPSNDKLILILSTRLEDDKCTASLLINLK